MSLSKLYKTLIALSTGCFGLASTAFAADKMTTFTQLAKNISISGNEIMRIVMVTITIAGILIVVKGIVHLKQNYVGTGQERHLPKAIACLIFGAALFIVVPITHMIVGGLSGKTPGYNAWTVTNDHAGSLDATGSYTPSTP